VGIHTKHYVPHCARWGVARFVARFDHNKQLQKQATSPSTKGEVLLYKEKVMPNKYSRKEFDFEKFSQEAERITGLVRSHDLEVLQTAEGDAELFSTAVEDPFTQLVAKLGRRRNNDCCLGC
jgi:hypothetical protein